MADTNIYATLHYVDAKRIKCASVGCEKPTDIDHKIETIIGQFEGHPATRKVELYFCHACYIDVKTILYSNLSHSVISGLEYKEITEKLKKALSESPELTEPMRNLARVATEEVQ